MQGRTKELSDQTSTTARAAAHGNAMGRLLADRPRCRWTAAAVLATALGCCCAPQSQLGDPNCPSQLQPHLSCPMYQGSNLTKCCQGNYQSFCVGPDDLCCPAYPHGLARCNSTDSCCSGGARASSSAFCCSPGKKCCSGSGHYFDPGRCCEPAEVCCPAYNDNGYGTCCKAGTTCCGSFSGGENICCTADQTCQNDPPGHYGPLCINKTTTTTVTD
jgi:hypothetical protein